MIRRVPALERRKRSRGDARAGEAVGNARSQAGTAVGRPAPARGAGARAHQPPARAAAGRAAGRARSEAARADAGGAQGPAAPGRHHLHLRHPRPGRGAVDERSPGRVQPRPHRADRHARGHLRASRDRVRGRLRRACPTSATASSRSACPARPSPFPSAPRRSASSMATPRRPTGGRRPRAWSTSVVYLGAVTRYVGGAGRRWPAHRRAAERRRPGQRPRRRRDGAAGLAATASAAASRERRREHCRRGATGARAAASASPPRSTCIRGCCCSCCSPRRCCGWA